MDTLILRVWNALFSARPVLTVTVYGLSTPMTQVLEIVRRDSSHGVAAFPRQTTDAVAGA